MCGLSRYGGSMVDGIYFFLFKCHCQLKAGRVCIVMCCRLVLSRGLDPDIG